LEFWGDVELVGIDIVIVEGDEGVVEDAEVADLVTAVVREKEAEQIMTVNEGVDIDGRADGVDVWIVVVGAEGGVDEQIVSADAALFVDELRRRGGSEDPFRWNIADSEFDPGDGVDGAGLIADPEVGVHYDELITIVININQAVGGGLGVQGAIGAEDAVYLFFENVVRFLEGIAELFDENILAALIDDAEYGGDGRERGGQVEIEFSGSAVEEGVVEPALDEGGGDAFIEIDIG
jgi:hypothetical protein